MPWGPIDSQTLQQLNVTVTALAAKLGNTLNSAPTITFAQLGSAAGRAGTIYYVSNGRKVGEGPGAGTGMTAFSDGGAWFSTAGTPLTV